MDKVKAYAFNTAAIMLTLYVTYDFFIKLTDIL